MAVEDFDGSVLRPADITRPEAQTIASTFQRGSRDALLTLAYEALVWFMAARDPKQMLGAIRLIGEIEGWIVPPSGGTGTTTTTR